MADNNDGYVSVVEAAQIGIAPTFFSDLVQQGLFSRVAKGLYIKRGYEEDDYYLLHYVYRKAVFGYRSSLYLQGVGEAPETPDLHLPLNYMTAGIPGANVRHLGKKEYGIGQSLSVTEKGNLVPCYDKERLFIDTIRLAPSLGGKACKTTLLSLYKKGLSPERLNQYAVEFGVAKELALAKTLLEIE